MHDDEGNYVVLPDPEAEAEEYFRGMSWAQITAELDRLEREAAEYMWQQHYWMQIDGDYYNG